MRLAFQGGVIAKIRRNFATIEWQNREKVILVEAYVDAEVMTANGFTDASSFPKSKRLKSQVRLDQSDWSQSAATFIKVLELAMIKYKADHKR
ncbi:hypothetical protein ACS0VU_14890 [Aliiroseovarius sp. KMU-71]|uniref:hypothetical protein n=1 Tax=Aliiroseovarius sp. KMU-71 TaxID=3453123 RepID=UPI003F45043A